ncbi:MAG: hypothetical protein LLF76_00300 [Planctomycetaceae bacterium]|nr:hypothetical protein [Planctomycetaceae bacterium]
MKIDKSGVNECWKVEVMDENRNPICVRHIVCYTAETAGRLALDQESRKSQRLYIGGITRLATVDLIAV